MALLLLRLPAWRSLVAAAGRGLRQTRPWASGHGGRSREGNCRGAVGGAGAIAGGLSLSAFSLFSREAQKEKGKDAEEGENQGTEEDTIIFLLKKAKLNIMKGELEEAEKILHEAARLSHQANNNKAIIYTYDVMANLAFLRGQLEHAEKLFKAAMSYLLAGDMKQDDNAIIEISLKLASIYAAQNQDNLALAGYEFCILTLEEKLAKEKDMPADALSEEEKADTRLLLGMSLDSYARYLLARNQAPAAQKMYERALQVATEVQGEMHPQSVVLMSDLATALDAQGLYDEAHTQVRRALELARRTEHPELHIMLNNLAGILMHKQEYSQAKEIYTEALKQAEKTGDSISAQHIRKELVKLAKRKKKQSKTASGLQSRGESSDE